MFNRLSGIGLDIGSQKIRMIQAAPKRTGLKIIKFGSTNTPPGTVEAGLIVDCERLGEELKLLVRRLKFNGKRVVSAVGGQQLYIRNLIMPRLKPEEMKEAVYYESTKFLPIPAEEAAIDICTLRDFEDETGKRTEVFFLAVRKQQVENLEYSCRMAGLKLAAVEIEPLSLFRVWGRRTEEVVALLYLGSERSYLTIFERGVPVFYHCLSAGVFSSYYTSPINQISKVRRWGEIININEPPYSHIVRITDEVKETLAYYQKSIKDALAPLSKILLCGRAAIPSLQNSLVQRLNLKVEAVNVLQSSTLPRGLSPEEENELQYDFSLALGLAARKVV
ncbi:MAG: pilus assembly protein PilM [Syntrophomonadaceae bacterium]|nr:pilus assembly protein PilM [Syntrophomonadaceae bacterium]